LEHSDDRFKELSKRGATDQKGDVYVRGATTLLDIALGTVTNAAGAATGKVVGIVGKGPSDGITKGADGPGLGRGDPDWDKKFGENPPKGWLETGGAKGTVDIGKGVTGRTQLDPTEISFSQATVAYQKKNSTLNYDGLVRSMKKDGWQGEPVDVVRMPDGAPTSVDNTRILAAREAGIKVEANVRNYNDPISDDQARRFILNGQVPKTWGEAVEFRVRKQSQMPGVDKSWAEKFSSGSIYDPEVTR
jgi:hypothetical protein